MHSPESLRRAEQKTATAVRRAGPQDHIADLERRLRQQMRLYPPKIVKNIDVFSAASTFKLGPGAPTQPHPQE